MPSAAFLSIFTYMKKTLTLIVLTGTLFFVGAFPAMAAAPKVLGKFGYWSAFQMYEGSNPVCYMSLTAKPPVKKGDKKTAKRGEVVLMITHRPAESSLDVISYAVGAKFKPSSDVTFKIGSKAFSLFTQSDTAWSRDQATDRAISDALRSGTSVTVAGALANGMVLADTVNLKGIAEAYYAIGKACGLDVAPPKKAAPAKAKTEKPAAKSTKTPEKKR